jgi:hypothetical protein
MVQRPQATVTNEAQQVADQLQKAKPVGQPTRDTNPADMTTVTSDKTADKTVKTDKPNA